MLILTRKPLEAVAVGGIAGSQRPLKVTVLEIKHGKVKLGFEASAEVPVHRWEIWERLRNNEPPRRGEGCIERTNER